MSDSKNFGKLALQIILPLALVGVGIVIAGGLASLRPEPTPKDTSITPPSMSLVRVAKGQETIAISVNGTVRAVDQADLTSQVAGRVEFVAEALNLGGAFKEGDLLVRIEANDFATAKLEATAMKLSAEARVVAAKAEVERLKVQRESAVIAQRSAEMSIEIAESDIAGARAQVSASEAEIGRAASEVSRAESAQATAESALRTEEALARLAKEEWEKYGVGEASDLALRKPQLAQARSAVDSAKSGKEAALKLAASANASKLGAEAALSAAIKRHELSKLSAENAAKTTELSDRLIDAAMAAVAVASADVSVAEASITRADLNLSRVEIRAPFNGRVAAKMVGLGQQVAPGAVLASIHSTDLLEIELPIPTDELPFLDLPTDGTGGLEPRKVKVEVQLGGSRYHYDGVLHRTGSQVTPGSRVLPAIVRVSGAANAEKPQLLIGTFAKCSLPGRTLQGLTRIPRRAVRPGAPATVEAAQPAPTDGTPYAWLLVATPTTAPAGADPAGKYVKLNLRRVLVGRNEGREILVSSGLNDGEMVADTAIEVITEGMVARVSGE